MEQNWVTQGAHSEVLTGPCIFPYHLVPKLVSYGDDAVHTSLLAGLQRPFFIPYGFQLSKIHEKNRFSSTRTISKGCQFKNDEIVSRKNVEEFREPKSMKKFGNILNNDVVCNHNALEKNFSSCFFSSFRTHLSPLRSRQRDQKKKQTELNKNDVSKNNLSDTVLKNSSVLKLLKGTSTRSYCSSPKYNLNCSVDDIKNRAESILPLHKKYIIPRENTLIILDYDDTLLPTNWVAVQRKIGLNDNLPIDVKLNLDELSELAIQTINFCRNHGKVIVITNASIEWVNRSGEKFIPAVWQYLTSTGIEIISARDRFQSMGLMQKQWKIKTFQEMINSVFYDRLDKGIECCVISIGDGDGEREACLEMCRQQNLHEWLFKSLKLINQPTCTQLKSEHALIQNAFREILMVQHSLDMTILDYNDSNLPSNSSLDSEDVDHVVKSDSIKNVKSNIFQCTDAFVDSISEQCSRL